MKKLGGTVTGNELTPLGTTDYSAYLIKAARCQSQRPATASAGLRHDQLSEADRSVRSGSSEIHVAGTQQELESLAGLPPEARIGIWMFEWYWKQPGVPHVAEFVADTAGNGGNVPTARHWFGYTSAMTVALVANQQKSLDAIKLAQALGRFRIAAGGQTAA